MLDIGCGSGYTLKIINSQFHHSALHGIDISELCGKEARRKNGKGLHNSSLDIGTYDVADLANEDDPIDIVTAFQNHYFWPDIYQACREIRRVLKPCGWFILTGDLYKMKYHLAKYQLIEEYSELLKSEKFSGIEVFPFHGFMIGY